MTGKGRVVVADDLSNVSQDGLDRSRKVLEAGLVLARCLKRPLDVLFVEDFWDFPDMSSPDRKMLEEWHRRNEFRLENIRRELRSSDRTLFKTGLAADQILRVLAGQPRPEMVVVGTQGRRGMDRLVVGSVAEEVIRNAKVPVMALGPAYHPPRKIRTGGPLRILLTTNLGPNSRQAEKYGFSLARRLRAKITLFHALGAVVWTSPGGLAAPEIYPYSPEEVLRGVREDAMAALAKRAKIFRKARIPCDIKVNVGIGAPSGRILAELRKGYDLLIMGTHGHSVVLSAFFGSVVRETILRSPVPVITVHSRP